MLVINGIGTWDQIDEHMNLHRLGALVRHWKKTPPVAEVIAGLLGMKTSGSSPAPKEVAGMQKMLADFGAAGIEVKKGRPSGG